MVMVRREFLWHSAGPVLCSVEDAEAEKIEAGAAIHGTLDELEPMDVAFDRSIAPWLLEGGQDSGFVPAKVSGEVGQRTR